MGRKPFKTEEEKKLSAKLRMQRYYLKKRQKIINDKRKNEEERLRIVNSNIDIIKLREELKESFFVSDTEDIDTDKITLIDIRVIKLNKENTIQLIDTHKGYLWKKGKLVSDIFDVATKAYKDARRALR